jgi:hypothetical protein
MKEHLEKKILMENLLNFFFGSKKQNKKKALKNQMLEYFFPKVFTIFVVLIMAFFLGSSTVVAETFNFENGTETLEFETNGNVPYGISDSYAHEGSYSLKVGPSSCGASCFDYYTVSITKQFDTPNYVSSISAWIYEEGNWGGGGFLKIDGEDIKDLSFSNISNNSSEQPGWVKKYWDINKSVSTITFYFYDMTSSNAMFIDDIEINTGENNTWPEPLNADGFVLTDKSGSANIWTAKYNGTALTPDKQLTFWNAPFVVSRFQVDEANQRIVYSYYETGKRIHHFRVIDFQGNEIQQITNVPSGGGGSASFDISPDGSQIVFAKGMEDQGLNQQEGWIVNINNTGLYKVLGSHAVRNQATHKTSFKWLDQDTIVFSNTEVWSDWAGRHEIHTLNVNTGSISKWAGNSSSTSIGEGYPVWSPDHAHMAVMTLANSTPSGIDVAQWSSGDSKSTLIPMNQVSAVPIYWVDNTRLVYVQDGDLYAVNMDGTDKINLTNTLSDKETQFVTVSGMSTSDGWQYTRKDLTGSNYYPNCSQVNTDNKLTEEFTLPVSGGSVLTGDVTGDGYMEIVHVNDSQLQIYDYQGNLLQNVGLGASGCIVTMIEDVNGDGINDIGIGTVAQSSLKTFFYDGQGNLLQELSKSAGYDSSMHPVGLTGNGDYIISLEAGYSHANKNRGIAVFDKETGVEKWDYRVGPYYRVVSVADFDSDGLLEITGMANTVHNGCTASGFNGNGTTTTDGDMWLIVVDENGNETFSKKYPSPSDGSSQHYFVDLNKDGQMEILGFESHDPTYYKGVSQVHLYDQTGTVTKSFDGNDNQGWSFAVADMTGDGKNEVVTVNGGGSSFTLHILDSQLNQLNSTAVDGSVQLVSDINGDGKNEIVILSSSGNLSVYDANLNELDSYSVNTNGKVIASDLDKDGIVELICLTDNLYVLKNSESKEQSFTLSASPTAGIAPLSVTFTVSGDVDSNTSFAWDFQGNNQVDSTSGPVVSHTYTQPGMYDASVSITPDSGPVQKHYIRIQVSKPPQEVPVEEVITGGGEGTKYIEPVNENYEITYQVEPVSETVEIDYMDYTYNVVTDAVIGCTVILDSRIINWAYAQTDNELSITLLDAGPSKAVPKTIQSSDIFTAPNQSETASASLTIELESLGKDITVALTPYKNISQIPALSKLQDLGYIPVSGADVAVSDSLGKKLFWSELSDSSSLNSSLSVQQDLLAAFSDNSSTNLNLLVFDHASRSWLEKPSATFISDNGLFISMGHVLDRLSPFVIARHMDTIAGNTSGQILGKVFSGPGDPLQCAYVTLMNEEGRPLGKPQWSDAQGLFTLDFAVQETTAEKYRVMAFHYSELPLSGLIQDIQIDPGEDQTILDMFDSDGDGVPDEWDYCPDTPLGSAVDSKGCLVEGPVDGTMPTLNGGWNLMGMNKSISQNISALVQGKEDIIASVWKWDNGKWAVYLPGEDDGGAAYAQSKGFSVLSNIEPGEGFWVNCSAEMTLD